MKQILKSFHSPTLDTILMVEDTIREVKEVIHIAELKRRLPRKVNHNTLKVILTYLQKSGKIEFTPDGVVWIFAPKEDISAILQEEITEDGNNRTRSSFRPRILVKEPIVQEFSSFTKRPKKTFDFKELTKEKIVLKLEENKKDLRSMGVKKLVLIGSYARGESTDQSDIDLLVEFEVGRGLSDDYMQLLHFLQDLFGKEIDLAEEHLLRDELRADILGGAKIEAKI